MLLNNYIGIFSYSAHVSRLKVVTVSHNSVFAPLDTNPIGRTIKKYGTGHVPSDFGT